MKLLLVQDFVDPAKGVIAGWENIQSVEDVPTRCDIQNHVEWELEYRTAHPEWESEYGEEKKGE